MTVTVTAEPINHPVVLLRRTPRNPYPNLCANFYSCMHPLRSPLGPLKKQRIATPPLHPSLTAPLRSSISPMCDIDTWVHCRLGLIGSAFEGLGGGGLLSGTFLYRGAIFPAIIFPLSFDSDVSESFGEISDG